MTCSDFLARYTDFRDGGLSLEAAGRCGDHLQSCPACRRYDEVVSRGTDLLRAMPGAEPPEDFQARLQHSIYSLHEERRRQRILRGGSGAMSVVAMTAIVATLVLVPVFWESDAVVELPPIVVAEPAAVVAEPAATAVATPSDRMPSAVVSAPFEQVELWTQSNALLYQRSSLYLRYREPDLSYARPNLGYGEPGLVRTGLQ